jgi:hypothetical protein
MRRVVDETKRYAKYTLKSFKPSTHTLSDLATHTKNWEQSLSVFLVVELLSLAGFEAIQTFKSVGVSGCEWEGGNLTTADRALPTAGHLRLLAFLGRSGRLESGKGVVSWHWPGGKLSFIKIRDTVHRHWFAGRLQLFNGLFSFL